MSSPNANTVARLNYQGNLASLVINPGNTNYIANDYFTNYLSPIKSLQFPGIGSTTITLGPRTASFAANTLGTTKHVYTSPLLSDIQALGAYFDDWGFSFNTVEGPVYIMTVDVSFDTITLADRNIAEVAAESWEITPVVGSKNLIYSGLIADPFDLTSNYNVMPLGLQAAVQRANSTGQNYVPLTSASFNQAQQAQYAPFLAEANTILRYLKLGQEGVTQYAQSIKRTACIDVNNTSGAFQTLADQEQKSINAQGSVNYIYSTPGLLAAYPIPANTVGAFMLPSYSKVLGVPNLDNIIYTVYAGWLVQPPTVQNIGRNKLQISQQFDWNEWSKGTYYMKSPATDFPLIYTQDDNLD